MKNLIKLFFSLLFAFLVSQFLVTKVTFKESPILRPSFQQFVHNLPTKIANQTREIVFLPKKILSRRKTPPPWIEPDIKPTIVSYKPPVYYPPTSTPKPTRPFEPTATPHAPPQTPTSPFTLSPTKSPSPSIPSSPSLPSPTPSPPQFPSQKKNELFSLINQERQKNGISSLGYNSALDNAAQGHADDMIQNNYFSHIGRDRSTPADRALRAGYGSSWVGENIAAGTSDPNQVFEMWMGSPGHRQNMLNPTWKSVGIGVSGIIWVLLLGAK